MLRLPFAGAAIILFLLVAVPSLSGLWLEWLWYRDDAQAPQIFEKLILVQAGLWLVGFVVPAVLFWIVSGKAADRIQLTLITGGPSAGRARSAWEAMQEEGSAEQQAARAALEFLRAAGPWPGRVLGIFVALAVAAGLRDLAEEVLLFTARSPFGQMAPIVNVDIGFFVFELPVYRRVLGLVALTASVAALISLLPGLLHGWVAKSVGLASAGSLPRASAAWTGGALVLVGLNAWLARFDTFTSPGRQFTGPGLADYTGFLWTGYAAWVIVLAGVCGLAGLFLAKPWSLLKPAGIAAVAAWIASAVIVPGVVEEWVVKPNRIAAEGPFAEHAIRMTRWAYGLDRFEETAFQVKEAPTRAELTTAENTLANMRLWDPLILERSLESIQSLRPFYEFSDVDLDRYVIDGQQRMVMIAPRDIQLAGLSRESQSWDALHLVYTHGYGATVSAVNASTPSGRPAFLTKNMPPESVDAFRKITEPRLYFGDFQPGSRAGAGYIIAPSNVEEFDFPTDNEDATHRWTGERGIRLDSFLTRWALALRKGDINIAISRAVNRDSRLVMRRDVVERASRVFPMLRIDQDPYLVITPEGRLVYILDGYTASDRVPYSAGNNTRLFRDNYIRNSVKITIDAYSGDLNAYAFLPDEPILKAIRRAIPNLIQDKSAMPEGLMAHIRYAEDGFLAQADVLTQYHVTDPRRFLSNEDAWQIPGENSERPRIDPYFVTMRLPGEDREKFMLILPFTPREKKNMIGWMAAHCDPEDYGKVVLYKFPKNTQTQGPEQMEATFNADPSIAEINRQLNNDQSRIVPGNLIIVPIGASILYVKPLFLESRSNPIPELKKVALGLQNRVAVGDTYQQALERLFGSVSDE
ncbi:MAG: UPF0182 family protein, partial [Fimbriimonadaceae bacterium]|nr:UPF0182 family protein [Fimbriimonadaceae bacterium]